MRVVPDNWPGGRPIMAGREAQRVSVAIGEEQSAMDLSLGYHALLAGRVAIMSSVH